MWGKRGGFRRLERTTRARGECERGRRVRARAGDASARRAVQQGEKQQGESIERAARKTRWILDGVRGTSDQRTRPSVAGSSWADRIGRRSEVIGEKSCVSTLCDDVLVCVPEWSVLVPRPAHGSWLVTDAGLCVCLGSRVVPCAVECGSCSC